MNMAKRIVIFSVIAATISIGLLFVDSLAWHPEGDAGWAKENRSPAKAFAREVQGSVEVAAGRNSTISTSSSTSIEDFHPSINNAWLEKHGFKSDQDMARLRALLNGQTELKPSMALHPIAISPSGEAQALDSQPRLLAQQRYLHASLPGEWLAGDDSVIVRWRRVSDGVVMELSAQPAPDASGQPMPIWMFRSTDWPLGHYRLEIIRPDPTLEQLAAGDFTITHDANAVSPVSFPIESSH